MRQPCSYGWGAGTNGQLCRPSGYASLTNDRNAGLVDSNIRWKDACASEDYSLMLANSEWTVFFTDFASAYVRLTLPQSLSIM